MPCEEKWSPDGETVMMFDVVKCMKSGACGCLWWGVWWHVFLVQITLWMMFACGMDIIMYEWCMLVVWIQLCMNGVILHVVWIQLCMNGVCLWYGYSYVWMVYVCGMDTVIYKWCMLVVWIQLCMNGVCIYSWSCLLLRLCTCIDQDL